MSEALLEWIKVGVPLVAGLIAGYLAVKFADPPKKLKGLSASPALSILASAAVMLAEAYWSEYGGEVQFEQACEWLSLWLHVPPEQVRGLVQATYEALKDGYLEWNHLGVPTRYMFWMEDDEEPLIEGINAAIGYEYCNPAS